MTITLYELQPSPHARKVRLLAAELGIPLNRVPVDPRIGETRTERDLLESILYPSLSFVRSFEPVLIVTDDGRTTSDLTRASSVITASASENW